MRTGHYRTVRMAKCKECEYDDIKFFDSGKATETTRQASDKKKDPGNCLSPCFLMVELSGIEPLTS